MLMLFLGGGCLKTRRSFAEEDPNGAQTILTIRIIVCGIELMSALLKIIQVICHEMHFMVQATHATLKDCKGS